MSSLKNLPPHVVRELLRHVSAPRPAASATTATSATNSHSNPALRRVLAGCALLTAAAASMPVVLYYWVGPLAEKNQPLTAPQVRRGAFVNSGTHDVGRDPDYDFRTGTHPLARASGATQAETSLPGEFLGMSEQEWKKHHDKIEAFAKGRGTNN